MLIDNVQNNRDGRANGKTMAQTITALMGKDKNREGSLDMVTGFFTIRGLKFLKEVMSDKTKFRMILAKIAGNPQEQDEKNAIDLLSEDNGIEAMINLSDDAKEVVEFLKRDTVAIRAIQNAFCHAKTYIFDDNNEDAFATYITGSSNLTDAGLGMIPTSNVELNVAETGKNSTFKEHQQWFNSLWNSIKNQETVLSNPSDPNSKKIPVKEYFINLITDTILRTYTPEDIYYKILYELFEAEIEAGSPEAQKDIALLQNTIIYKTLFDYQQKGVISLIKMLENYGGAILADAVGLGKTFSALATMWYFQNKGYTVAVFCPKKLQQNWEQYRQFAGSRFEDDRFNYIVDFHTDLQDGRLKNKTHGSLSLLQSAKKLLIVIDESHNLRNDKSARYKELLEEIIRKDDDKRVVKVLQLSATPINNKLTDVRNQFNLIGHGRDSAFDELFEIASLDSLFRDAQMKFNDWSKDDKRTVGKLIDKLPKRFFDLTDKLLVARTRKMIEETANGELGFPKKEKPDNIYQGIDELGKYKSFDDIFDALTAPNLTAYKPSLYLGQRDKSDWQDDSYREVSLVMMMVTLFTKRLESSWYSCYTTVSRVLQVHQGTLAAVDRYMAHGGPGTIEWDDFDEENEEEIYDDIPETIGKKKINLSEMVEIEQFREDLAKDVEKLEEFYKNISSFKSAFEAGRKKDKKLEKLSDIIKRKQHKKNKKVVVFTAFSDTAEYLFRELSKRKGFEKIACVTGNGARTLAGGTSKYDGILQRFAPYSKLYKEKDWSRLYDIKGMPDKYFNTEKGMWDVPYEKWIEFVRMNDPDTTALLNTEIDILIATDCLSEGQNLQDADMVINYDIHWNPVRLIQRFGRIDRIGSRNKSIQAVNFWPASDYEKVLNLATKINNRMAAMTLVGAETIDINDEFKSIVSDNPLLDSQTQKLLEQLRDNSISDIESVQTVGLHDFSLESFRQDLVEYLNKNKEFFKKMPKGAYSGFELAPNLFEDVPESLVAVIGYPKKNPNKKEQRYEKLYLMCQPVEANARTVMEEVNMAQVLDFLRKNKLQSTKLPEWIEKPSQEKINKLTGIIKSWMEKQVPAAAADVLEGFALGNVATQDGRLLEDKFKVENFDLIAWEYVSRKK